MNSATNNSTTVTLKNISLFFLMGAILCLSCSFSLAQKMDFHKVYFHPHQQLTGNYMEVKENNLSIKGTQVLYQSSDQTIWIGTQNDGVISYTGNYIKHYRFDPNNKNSLSSNRIEEIWEESSTVLWITTNDGIVKFDRLANRFTRFSAKTRFVRKTPDGALYTSVFGEGLFRIDTLHHHLINAQQPNVLDEKGQTYAGETVKGILKMDTDKDGILWAVGNTKTFAGLFNFDPKSGYWIFHEPATFNVQPDTSKLDIHTMFGASTLFIDAANHIWFGSWGTGLNCYDKKTGQWQQYSFYRSAAKKLYDDNVVLNIYPLNKNELWITSFYNGFNFNFQKGTVSASIWSDDMDTALKFGKKAAFTMLDHCGNRWVATNSNIYKSNPVSNSFSSKDEGISSLVQKKIITAFYQLRPQHYLLGVNGPAMHDGIYKTDILEIENGHIIRDFFVKPFTNNSTVRQFIPLGDNEFYVCGFLFYKLNLKKNKLETIRIKISKEADYSGIYIDSYNNFLWNDSILYSCRRTTGAAGLVRVNIEKSEAQIYKTSSTKLSPYAPQDNEVVRMTKDSYNRLWCGTAGGVDIFYPGKEIFEHYSPVEGDSTSLLGSKTPRVCEASDHTIYVASQSGVCATKAVPGTRATFTPVAYLDCDWILADKANMLWVGTPRGVARINPANKTYKLFDVKDGYYWDPFRKPFVMPDGRFIMPDGVIIDPSSITQNSFKPIPRLSDFLVEGQPFPLDTAIEFKKHIHLKNDQNFFSISYTCNSYVSEEENTYRYKLDGIDNNWIDAGSRTMAYYTALPPGIYYFYVQAANNDGVWGKAKQLLTITIIPAWYQTWWFKPGIAVIVIISLYALYRQQLTKERAWRLAEKRASELQQREAEIKQIKTEFEKQLAETEMAALRSQMNPHFIFNVLNSINKYILSNNKNAASDYLVQFSRLIRLTLENSRALKVPLKSDLEALRIYIEMEKLRFGNRFFFSIDLDENIDPQYVQIPPLLIQPYVENAIWHGLMQKDSVGFLQIKITQQDENLVKVIVQDNGIGREKAQEIKSKSATAHKSYGLQITSDRIEIVNKLHGINARATVDDLYDDAQQPAGTKVTILIPV